MFRFSVAGTTRVWGAEAAGDRKAPRHEIAVGDAWRCREYYEKVVGAMVLAVSTAIGGPAARFGEGSRLPSCSF